MRKQSAKPSEPPVAGILVVDGHVARLEDVADFFEVALQTVKGWRRKDPPMPDRGEHGWPLREIIAWLYTVGPRRPEQNTKFTEEDFELIAGGESPALERYRLARAKLAELDLAEKRKEVIAADDVRQMFAIVGGTIRRAGQQLTRRYGPKAFEMLSQALDQADEQIRNMTGDEGENEE